MKYIAAIFAGFCLLLFLVLFDYFYYPAIGFRASTAAEEYLETEYEKNFIVDETRYGKILGEKQGSYTVTAHLENRPEIHVQISVSQKMEVLSENYLKMKWRQELNQQVKEFLDQRTEKFLLRANVSIPDDIEDRYEAEDSYQAILEETPGQISNYLFLYMLRDSSMKPEEEQEWLYDLIVYLKQQELEQFTIRVYFYAGEQIEGLTVQEVTIDELEEKYREGLTSVFQLESNSEESRVLNEPADLRALFREVPPVQDAP